MSDKFLKNIERLICLLFLRVRYHEMCFGFLRTMLSDTIFDRDQIGSFVKKNIEFKYRFISNDNSIFRWTEV